MRSAIQLYSIRDVDVPYLDLIDRVGETSFAGVEFAKRVGEAEPAAIRERLAANDLEAVAAHVSIDDLENDFDAVVERAHALGYEHVVVPWIEPEGWESVAAVEVTAHRLATLVDALAAEGLTLHYHNHDQEFVETEEGTAYHLLAELLPDLHLQVDAGWALAGGEDPAELLRRYGHRITLVHLKDVTVGMTATDELTPADVPALGAGDLDLDAVAEAAHDVGAEWLIYENDQPDDPEAALAHGADVLSRYV